MNHTVGVSLQVLFAQLGLPSEQAAVSTFLAQHRPLAGDLALPDAPFWTVRERAFLYEAWRVDSIWAGVVDELKLRFALQHPPYTAYLSKTDGA